jgi:hypothetical protein
MKSSQELSPVDSAGEQLAKQYGLTVKEELRVLYQECAESKRISFNSEGNYGINHISPRARGLW